MSSNYKNNLYELLPQLYHNYDRGDGSLKDFMEAIGETLDDIERSIEELYGDSFIESCHEWVVPYIGQLIGAKLLGNDGNRDRQEVMKTIHWRKRKGTLQGLEDMAAGITGWGVRAAEFFEQLGWSQNLNHLKLDHLQTIDLRDHKALFHLGSADNMLLHNIDIREPSSAKGWFQIKNIGFFLSTVALSHYTKVRMQKIDADPARYTIEPEDYSVNLFDSITRFPLSKTVDHKERFKRFGLGQTVDIYSRGIPAATPEMPKWTGIPPDEPAPPDVSILKLKDGAEFHPVDWKVVDGEPLKYTITPMVLFENPTTGKAVLEPLGNLDLNASSISYISENFDISSTDEDNARLIVRVMVQPGFKRAFPGMVLKIQSVPDSRNYFVFENDRRRGVYKDRMYCYLPGLCPQSDGNPTDFVIDRYGSAYRYIHDGTKGQPEDQELYHFTKLARLTEGVIYPSRKLTASNTALLPVYSLAEDLALQVVDRGQFITDPVSVEGWTIKAWNRENKPGGGVLRLLSSIKITSASDQVVRDLRQNETCQSPGNLIISLHRDTMGWIPQMELSVTDERGRSILVYLPQVDDLDNAGKFFYVADDGATYKINTYPIQGGLVVRRTPETGDNSAFTEKLLARYSAGQVLPIEGKSPIQQRIPVRCDLSGGAKAFPGLLAIDPVIGRVAFAGGEEPNEPVYASYYHGLSSYLGAGPYYHSLDMAEEDRLIRVSKHSAPDNTRHLRPPEAGQVSKVPIFSEVQDAVDEAVSRRNSTSNSPLIIRIEDSQTYNGGIQVNQSFPNGLIIRAAQFQRPVLREEGILCSCPDDKQTPLLAFQGLKIDRPVTLSSGRFKEILFKDCTILGELHILAEVKGEQDRYLKLTLDNCIIKDRVLIDGYCEVSIVNCALDPDGQSALEANLSEVRIDRCTVLGEVAVKVILASESIFMKRVVAINAQKGCVRYCRIEKTGNTLPYQYRCMNDPVTFCSDLHWRSDYLKLKRICNAQATRWAENGGEIGAYHQAYYTLKQKNLRLKFEEYLPVGLTPVLIDTESV